MITLIAFFTMIIDHIGIIFYPNTQFLRIIGRFSFPLFAWGIARGFKYTRSLLRYSFRLLLISIISQVPYSILFKNNNLNVCFTLLAGLILIKLYTIKFSNKKIKYFIVLIISFLLFLSNNILEYGFYGILTILIFYIFYNDDSIIFWQFFITLLGIIILKYDPIQLFSVFSCFIIFIVNTIKLDFKINKIFSYTFYPLHLLILYFIKIGGVLK